MIIKSKKPGFKKKFFENVSNEYKLKDLFFGSNIRSESYAIDDYEIINDSVLKIINYDEFNNSVIDEKIISIKATSNEKIGFIGDGLGIAAESIVQITNEQLY